MFSHTDFYRSFFLLADCRRSTGREPLNWGAEGEAWVPDLGDWWLSISPESQGEFSVLLLLQVHSFVAFLFSFHSASWRIGISFPSTQWLGFLAHTCSLMTAVMTSLGTHSVFVSCVSWFCQHLTEVVLFFFSRLFVSNVPIKPAIATAAHQLKPAVALMICPANTSSERQPAAMSPTEVLGS